MASRVIAAVTMVLSVLIALALQSGSTAAEEPQRKVAFSEGFEGDGKMRFWTSNGPYKVNFAGPTEERAAGGKRSFKIDVTWTDCTRNYWWSAPLMIPYYGNPVVRGKLYVERGDAELGHAYAMPVGPTSGGGAHGEKAGELQNGWTVWKSGPAAFATPGMARAWAETHSGIIPLKSVPTPEADDTIYLQAVVLFLKPDKQRRTVVYIDDIQVEAALPDGYRERLKARIAEIESERRALILEAAAHLSRQFDKLSVETRDLAALSLPGASPALRDCYDRLREHCRQMRSLLQAALAELQTSPKPATLRSARRSVALLRKGCASWRAFTSYAGAHSDLPYVVWLVDPISNENVLPQRFPVPGTIGTELSLSACPGEYEPVSFAVYAPKGLREVKAEPTEARCGEVTIPASEINIRIVKCWWQAGVGVGDTRHPTLTPELLLKDPDLVRVENQRKRNMLRNPQTPRDARQLQPVTIPAATTQQFWVTVHVPENAQPGTYRGTIRLSTATTAAIQLPLTIEVLPFHLEPSVLQYSIYYTGLLSDDLRAETQLLPPRGNSPCKNQRQYLAEMVDLKAHGITHPTCYQSVGELLDRVIELRKQAGIAVDPLYFHGIGTGAPQSPQGIAALQQRVRGALAQVHKHGIKELYIYGIDEAKGERLKAERQAFRAVHEAGAKVFIACHVGTFELVGDLLDLANCAGPPVPSEAKKWHSVGHRIFNYANPQCGMEQPETYRRNYGLLLWKAGYDGAMNMGYQSVGGDPWDDFDDRWRDHNMVYSTIDDVIPTIQWEGFREGVDDVRYITTLLKMIKRAKSDQAKRQLATEAEKWVKTMDITGDLDALRAKIVDWIVRLSS